MKKNNLSKVLGTVAGVVNAFSFICIASECDREDWFMIKLAFIAIFIVCSVLCAYFYDPEYVVDKLYAILDEIVGSAYSIIAVIGVATHDEDTKFSKKYAPLYEIYDEVDSYFELFFVLKNMYKEKA